MHAGKSATVGGHGGKSECIKVVYCLFCCSVAKPYSNIEFDADLLLLKKFKMAVSSTFPIPFNKSFSVVEMRRERGEVTIKKSGGDDQPKTFTFDSVYDQE